MTSVILFFLLSAFAQEKFKLSDGMEILVYPSNPPLKPSQECNKYAIHKKGNTYEFVTDGVKKVSTGEMLIVSNGCVLTFTGKLELNNGKSVDFFQDNVQNDGELVFWSGTNKALPNGKYQTKKGTKFEVKGSQIQNYG
jgi:hypothetical protein